MKIIDCGRKNLNQIPSTFGVYIFYSGKEILYIGKSINLKARIASHFENAKIDNKEAAIVNNSQKIKILTSESEFKALLLESNLIKNYKPKYNVIWRDDKSYLYIKITIKDKYPKVYTVRKENDKKSLYFGPFSSNRLVRYLLKEIRKIFPFCTQKNITKRACFYSKINLCRPCPSWIESIANTEEKTKQQKIYKANIRNIIKILQGKTDLLLKDFYNKIENDTREENYEEAIKTRDRMLILEKLISDRLFINIDNLNNHTPDEINQELLKIVQKYFPHINNINRIECYDISNLGGKLATASMVVITDGFVNKSEYRRFKIKPQKQDINSDFAMLDQVVKRRFKNSWEKPDLIVVDGGKPQVTTVLKTLSQININIPLIGIAKNPDRLIIGINHLPTIKISFNNQGFNLIRLIRDESHHFAKKYHLLLRRKKLI